MLMARRMCACTLCATQLLPRLARRCCALRCDAGVFSLLAATEITDGVYYPLGGFQKVCACLWRHAIAECVSTVSGASGTSSCGCS